MKNEINHSALLTSARFQPKVISPTDEQLAIQTATDRSIVIEANAGAAKTTTLALRMAETWARGTRPENFLSLTYTKTACDALKSTLKKIGVPYSVITQFRIQTFEAFCTEVLKEILCESVKVIDNAEALKTIVWEAINYVERHEKERWRDHLLMPALGDNGAVEKFLRLNIWLKGTMRDVRERQDNTVTPDYAESIGVDYTQLKIFLAYELIRRRQNAEIPLFRGELDATYDLARMLHDDESVEGLKSWPSSIKVLMVDEMHDLNQSMFGVLQAILNTVPVFFCGVGDLDQVIHMETGADAKFMRSEIEAYTRRTVKRYPLTHSYRFSQSLAIKVGRIAGKPYSSMAEHETKVSLLAYKDEEDCALQVVQEAVRWKAQPRSKMAELAILLRHPHDSVHIENGLLSQEIPYMMSGIESYLMRPEVLFIRGILAVATDNLNSITEDQTRQKVMRSLVFFSGSRIHVKGREHESQEALLNDAIRSVTDNPNFLTSFFENQVLRNAELSMKNRLTAAIAVAQQKPAPDLLARMLEALKIESIIRDVFVSKQRRQEALGNLSGLKQAAQKFESASAYFTSLNDAEQKQQNLKKSASLVIASIENVKGLEFDHVILPYLEFGKFPEPDAPTDEEKNIFYVGVTRSRKFLTLLGNPNSPSQFLEKMGYKSAPRHS